MGIELLPRPGMAALPKPIFGSSLSLRLQSRAYERHLFQCPVMLSVERCNRCFPLLSQLSRYCFVRLSLTIPSQLQESEPTYGSISLPLTSRWGIFLCQPDLCFINPMINSMILAKMKGNRPQALSTGKIAKTLTFNQVHRDLMP